MKQRVKSIQRMAHQLTNPKPEFVSHVRHGANQTPFRTVKGDIADFSDLELEENVMAGKADIQKVVFKSANFDSADKVTEYLEAKGFTDFAVKKTKSGFEVLANDTADFDGDLKEISPDAGVTMFVGKLAEGKEGTQKKAEQVEMKKVFKLDGKTSEQIVKKYCDCYGGYSCYTPPAGKTIADVLTEQYSNGSFPAFYELNSAFTSALYNLVKDGDTASITALSAEYGSMIVSILTALSEAGVDTTVVKQAFLKTPEKEIEMAKEKTAKADAPKDQKDPKTPAKKADPKDQDDVGADAEDEADEDDADSDDADEDTADDEADEGETETEKAAKDKAKPKDGKDAKGKENSDAKDKAKKSDANDIASIIAKAVSDAVSPLKDAVETLQATVDEVQKATKEGLTDIEEKVGKTSDRVDELSNARQSRKSADENGVRTSAQKSDEDEDDVKETPYQARMRKDALGIS